MIQRLTPELCRLNKDIQIALSLLLSDVLMQPLGTESKLSLVLPCQRRGDKRFRAVFGFVCVINAHCPSLTSSFSSALP